MNNDYFILEKDEQKGPFTFNELVEMEIDLHTRVLSPLADGWQDACDLPEFFEYFGSMGIVFPTEDNLASFWWRLLAFFIDLLLVSFLLSFFIMVFDPALIKVLDPSLMFDKVKFLAERQKISYITFGLFFIYNALFEASGLKGTIGKKLCRLVVVDGDGVGPTFLMAVSRNLGKAVTMYFLFGIGFLSIFWSEYRQAMHDYLAKTYVVKVG
jgi:uncharacterized RDD family membrane protein YckC